MSTRRGTNLPRMGDFNQAVVVEAIRRAGEALSRTELAAATGLSAQTLTNITRRLLDDGLIAEAGRAINGPGKPRVLLRLVAESRYSVGVHLDPAVVTVVLLDLAGTAVARRLIPVGAPEPARVIDAMAQAIEAVIGEAGVDRSRIVGIGLAAPGPLDEANGTVVDPPMLRGWRRVPLRTLLSEATGFAVVLEKDTAAAAVGELWTRRGPVDDSFVLLYLGTGLGAALARDGDVTRGRIGNFGEIGHIVVDPEGPACACGSRGCVAVTCTPQAIVAEAVRAGVLPPDGDEDEAGALEDRFAAVCARAERGEPFASGILARAARCTAALLVILTDVLDVERIVLGGPFWGYVSAVYLAELPEHVHRASATRALREIPIHGSVVGADVGAVGAACVVLNEALTPRASSLLLSERVVAPVAP
ncbi:ROK family protein [Microbacterium sp. NPDC008134]|uniref:ROK family transcriptional regulator n=1 Tax=Microbacterium sp. NPDC008134 TaxID=3364183 RepID=UPI0036E76564